MHCQDCRRFGPDTFRSQMMSRMIRIWFIIIIIIYLYYFWRWLPSRSLQWMTLDSSCMKRHGYYGIQAHG